MKDVHVIVRRTDDEVGETVPVDVADVGRPAEAWLSLVANERGSGLEQRR
jgi:hypothetical protein